MQKIEIPVSGKNAEYYSDLTREKLPITEKDGSIVIDVSESAYFSLPISLEEMKKLLSAAKVI